MATKRTRRVYAPSEIQAALTTLAFFGGNSLRTQERTGISASTLRLWRTTEHRDLYREIQEREAPKLEAIAADQALEVILRSSEVEHSLLDALASVAHDPEQSKTASEIAGALQRTVTSRGISTTKRLELTGRPTSIVEHRDGNDILRSLGSRIPGLVVESTATELRSNALAASETRALPSLTDAANARGMAPVQTGAVEPRTDRSA
jgi:hypothetical protein